METEREPEPPWCFGDKDFTIVYKAKINEYVEFRVQGYDSSSSLAKAFGAENAPPREQSTYRRIHFLENNPYYLARFKKRLEEVTIAELWNVKLSIHEMLSIMRSPYTKDTAQLNAAKELNVLCGITVVDENGKTRVGKSLEDFYKNEGKPGAAMLEDSDSTPENNR
jgi:hypothetical protein